MNWVYRWIGNPKKGVQWSSIMYRGHYYYLHHSILSHFYIKMRKPRANIIPQYMGPILLVSDSCHKFLPSYTLLLHFTIVKSDCTLYLSEFSAHSQLEARVKLREKRKTTLLTQLFLHVSNPIWSSVHHSLPRYYFVQQHPFIFEDV